ncbi:hypothetical protein ACHAQH_003946 [Verticillium albo-atrum]
MDETNQTKDAGGREKKDMANKNEKRPGSSTSETPKTPPPRPRPRPASGISTHRPLSFSGRAVETPLTGRFSRRSMGFDSPLGRIPETAGTRTPDHTVLFGGYSGLEGMRDALERQARVIEKLVLKQKGVAAEAEDARKGRIEAELAGEKLQRRVEDLARRLKEKEKVAQVFAQVFAQVDPITASSTTHTATEREKALLKELAAAKEEISGLEASLVESDESARRAEKFLSETELRMKVLEQKHEEDRTAWRSMAYSETEVEDGRLQKNLGKSKLGPFSGKVSPRAESPGHTSNSGVGNLEKESDSTRATASVSSSDEESSVDEEEGYPEDEDDDDSILGGQLDYDSAESVTLLRADWDALLEEYSMLQNMKEIFQFGAAAQDTLRAAADAGRENEMFEMLDIEDILKADFKSEEQDEDEQKHDAGELRSKVLMLKDKVEELSKCVESSSRLVDKLQSQLDDAEKEKSSLAGQLAAAVAKVEDLDSISAQSTVSAEAERKLFHSLNKVLQDKHQRRESLRSALEKDFDQQHMDDLRKSLASSTHALRVALTELSEIPGRELVREHDMCQEEISALEQQLIKTKAQTTEQLGDPLALGQHRNPATAELQSKIKSMEMEYKIKADDWEEEKKALSDRLAQAKPRTTDELPARMAKEDRTIWAWIWEFLSALGPILGGNALAWKRLFKFLWALLLYIGLSAYGFVVDTGLRVWAWSKGMSLTGPARRRPSFAWSQLQPGDLATVLFHVALLCIALKTTLTWWALKEQQQIWFGSNSTTRAYYHDVKASGIKMVDGRFFGRGVHALDNALQAIDRWLRLLFDMALDDEGSMDLLAADIS